MALPYDYARCTGTTHAACQVCRRREPGREHWQPYMNNPPINMLTGECSEFIEPPHSYVSNSTMPNGLVTWRQQHDGT